MGLDMYLYVNKYESKTHWNKNKNISIKDFYPKELHYLANKHYKRNFLSKVTMYQIGYWRKANAIHNWFVEYCGNGEDKCQEMYVSMKHLDMLQKECEKAIANKEQASAILPTKKGCFFGSLEYDDYYFEDIKYTIELVKRVKSFLKKNKEYECWYQASW